MLNFKTHMNSKGVGRGNDRGFALHNIHWLAETERTQHKSLWHFSRNNLTHRKTPQNANKPNKNTHQELRTCPYWPPCGSDCSPRWDQNSQCWSAPSRGPAHGYCYWYRNRYVSYQSGGREKRVRKGCAERKRNIKEDFIRCECHQKPFKKVKTEKQQPN